MTPSRILITGATGFIGSRLCERMMLDYQLPYRALVRNFARAPRIARLGCEMVAGSVDDIQAIDRALEHCDTVVHLAFSHPSHTRSLVNACRRRGIARFVHISSIAVHGPQPGPECAREETAGIGHYPGQDYSNMKAAAELAVQTAIKQGFPAVILRPTIVYGPYGPFVSSIVNTSRTLGVFTLLDQGGGICNAVYVDDLCDAIRDAIATDTGVGSAFFVNGDRAVSWREFNLTFARMVDPPPRIVSMNSDEVRRHWAAQRPTLKSNILAAGRLAMAPEFHRQLGTVPALGSLIKFGKEMAKRMLSPERTAALKQMRSGSGGSPAMEPDVPWPDPGRIVRECMQLEFSNERARTVLGWQPKFDLAAGAAGTRTWLDFAGMLSADDRPLTGR